MSGKHPPEADPAGPAARCADQEVAAIMAEVLFLTPVEQRHQVMRQLHAPILSAVLTHAVLTQPQGCDRHAAGPSDN